MKNKKLVGILIGMLLIASLFPVTAIGNNDNSNRNNTASFAFDEWPMLYHDSQRTGFSTSDAPETNNTKWGSDIERYPQSSPIVADGKIYVNVFNFITGIFNSSSGESINSFTQKSLSAMAVSEGKLFISADDYYLYCYSTSNFSTYLWSVSLGTMSGLYAPIVSNGHIYQAYQDIDTLYTNITVRDASTGMPLFHLTLILIACYPRILLLILTKSILH